ncbi:MAG: hypothetical protein NTU63_00745 [Candidatus Pacearchaeota archaeon]|nr:hypothetical protein [Candidatus Pacearchaeota archaeon]
MHKFQISEESILGIEKIDTDLIRQFKEGLEDLKSGRVRKVDKQKELII